MAKTSVMLLDAVLGLFAFSWACWFTYMLRYPQRWSAQVDRHRQLFLACCINLPWMHQAEKGWLIKLLVAVTVLITLLCIVILLRHPTALQDFWRNLRTYSTTG